MNQSLTSLGVKPNETGLRDFFASYSPKSSSAQRVGALINQLGSESFAERTDATNKLAMINLTDLPLVQKATENADLEISLRAQQVIRMFQKGTHLKRLSRVLRLMEKHKIKGFAEELSVALQVVRPSSLLKIQFENTMAQTVTNADSKIIRGHVNDLSIHNRDIYIRVLSKMEPETHAELFSRLAGEDKNDDVVLSAAIELVKIPDRRCLRPLIELLDNPSIRIRSRANQMLRMVSGKKFGFVAVANQESRQKAIEKWTVWNRDEGNKAVLIKDAMPSKIFLNRLIVSSYTQKKVFETDLEGKVLRTLTSVGSPMGVCGAEDGSVLVCDYVGKQVLVFDSNDKIVFRKKVASGPLSGELLDNGNILVGVSSSKKILEIDREGNTVWQAELPSRINVVHRTPQNTTLASMMGHGKVVELDESGKIIFELEVHKPNGARRLENGNTLICLYDKGEVHEYDPDKKIVWKATGLKKPARAQRMPNGETLIFHREGVSVFGSTEKMVRQIKIKELRSGDVGSLHFF